jgi:hypothetical protein
MIGFTSSVPSTAVVGGPRVRPDAHLPCPPGGVHRLPDAYGAHRRIRGHRAFRRRWDLHAEAFQPGNEDYDEAPPVKQSFTIAKRPQTVTIISPPPAEALVGDSYTLVASASSGLAVLFSSTTPAVCSLEGATVKPLSAGTCTIEAEQAGDSEYMPAPPASLSFTVARRPQSLAFISTPPTAATVGGGYNVAASASSGLPASFWSATPGVCSVTGTSPTFLGPGTCTIHAEQPGDAEYLPAPPVTQSFAVALAPPPSTPPPSAPSSSLAGSEPREPLLAPAPSPLADSAFRLARRPLVQRRTGAITFAVSLTDPGMLRWTLTFANGRFGAFSARLRRCGAGRTPIRGRCLPARVLFGNGSLHVRGSGTSTFTVLPSRAARMALRRARRRGRPLRVVALVSFQSALGGAPVTRTYVVGDKLGRRRRGG